MERAALASLQHEIVARKHSNIFEWVMKILLRRRISEMLECMSKEWKHISEGIWACFGIAARGQNRAKIGRSGDPWARRALGARTVLINIYCGRNFVRFCKNRPSIRRWRVPAACKNFGFLTSHFDRKCENDKNRWKIANFGQFSGGPKMSEKWQILAIFWRFAKT